MATKQPSGEKFETELLLAGELIRRIGRRYHLRHAEAEDFNSYALFKLIEDDYATLRSFQGRSKLVTFLTVVVQRLFLDYRVQKWGKWRPLAEVRDLGPAAVELDRLMNRDGHPLPNAVEIVYSHSGGALTREHLFELATRLPQRQRPFFEGIEHLDQIPTHGDVEEILEGQERNRIAKRVHSALTRALQEMSAEDRLILKMRHEDGFTVREIAKALHLEARPLYTRFEKCHLRLRESLEETGITWEEVSAILGWVDCDLEAVFNSEPERPIHSPSKTPRLWTMKYNSPNTRLSEI